MRTERTVLINDADAAGVVFAARAVAMAHEAYEQAMGEVGLPLATVVAQRRFALPLVRVEADFRRPLRHGDRIASRLSVETVSERSYQVRIDLLLGDEVAVSVLQVHVYLDCSSGRAVALPVELLKILKALKALESNPA